MYPSLTFKVSNKMYNQYKTTFLSKRVQRAKEVCYYAATFTLSIYLYFFLLINTYEVINSCSSESELSPAAACKTRISFLNFACTCHLTFCWQGDLSLSNYSISYSRRPVILFSNLSSKHFFDWSRPKLSLSNVGPAAPVSDYRHHLWKMGNVIRHANNLVKVNFCRGCLQNS